MRFLVTGASGFVGAAMCAELVTRGFEVRAAARRAVPGYACFLHQSIDGQTPWAEALEGVEVVVHLAARVHVMQEEVADPFAEFIRVNVEGTLNLARQASRAGVKRFVYVSSVKVHGECTPLQSAFSESSPLQPQDPYGLSKLQAEQALLDLGRETGLEVVIVRPPLVYGPGVRANFAQLMKMVDRGFPLPFKGIANRRSLVFVGNLVDSLILCATHPAAAGQTYLVDDGVPLSTSELVACIAEGLGAPNRDFFFPLSLLRLAGWLLRRPGAVERLTQSLLLDSSKIRSQLGWAPPFDMTAGMKMTASWFKKHSHQGA
ncbi:MAG: UDP-glucose 4-epimerase family protein [Pseudomonas sp.]|uniref:UDP-glucose 4-epimerase family protein n=1 Tax=Pseudomonas sp. TaxID=306 RepID=UPI003D0B62A6